MGAAFHFPLFIIFIPMMASIVMPLLKNTETARAITLGVQLVLIMLSLGLVAALWNAPAAYFIYLMGYFPSPWGNEVRAGLFEAILALTFSTVLLFCILGTGYDTKKDVPESKRSLFYCLINLLNCSLMALVFANDIFTAYVFIEVNTLAACAIVVVKENRDTLKATIKYLFLSVMGSGLFLMSTALLYGITGHLLMEPINDSITVLVATGEYYFPLTLTMLLFIVSLAVKSALFPFHTWLPEAHGSATTAASAILSGLVVKGYVVMLMKMIYRVYGVDTLAALGVFHVLFLLGITGMVAGSVMACFQTRIKRLIAYSSVGQIGYIFMGMGLYTQGGFVAAGYHIIAHAFTKSMLFIAAGALISASGSYNIADLTGAARKNKMAGIAFTVGALSMVGIPLFAGFVSKFYLAGAAVQGQHSIWITLPVLAISTFLNGLYYFPVLVRIYSKPEEEAGDAVPAAAVVAKPVPSFAANFTLVCLIAANVALGVLFAPLLAAIEVGFIWLG